MRFFSIAKHRRILPTLFTLLFFFVALFFLRKVEVLAYGFNALRGGLYRFGETSARLTMMILSDRQALVVQNDKLRAQVMALTIEEAQFTEFARAYEDLTNLLGYQNRTSYSLVTARLLSRATLRSGELVLIDRGSADGIAEGQAVLAGDGVLVGRIQEITETTSVVRLVTDRESRIGVRLLNGGDTTIGIAEGSDGTVMRVSYIPQDVSVDANDLLVTSGLDASIPSGIPLGLVTDIVADEHDPFQTATAEPIMDLRQLTFVSILILTP